MNNEVWKDMRISVAFLMAMALLMRYTNYVITHMPLPVHTADANASVDETDMPFR